MRRFFASDVYIRLAEDDSAFVCTVKRGGLFAWFLAKTMEFAWKAWPTAEVVAEKAQVPAKRGVSESGN